MVDGNLTNSWSGSKAQPGLGTTDLGRLALVMNFCLISHLLLSTFFQADFLRVLTSASNTYTTPRVLRAKHIHCRHRVCKGPFLLKGTHAGRLPAPSLCVSHLLSNSCSCSLPAVCPPIQGYTFTLPGSPMAPPAFLPGPAPRSGP